MKGIFYIRPYAICTDAMIQKINHVTSPDYHPSLHPLCVTLEEEEDNEEEDVAEAEELDEVQTESSGEEEASEQVSQQPQQATEMPKDTLAVSQTNAAPSLPPPPSVTAASPVNQVTIWRSYCPIYCVLDVFFLF